MKPLDPLARLLRRALRWLLFRRIVAWLACTAILITLGGSLASFLGPARVFRLGLVMAAVSALPAFLLWPPGERFFLERLRRLDEEMDFEAYLEAGPGPVRELLRRRVAGRAACLQAPRERCTEGLGRLLAAAAVCVVLGETGSLFFRGRALGLGLESPPAPGGGARLEEEGFSEYATEDPAARQARRERFLNPEGAGDREDAGSGRGAFAAQEGTPGVGGGKGLEASDSGSPSLKESLAKRKQGDFEEPAPTAGQGPAPSPGEGTRADSGTQPEGGGTPQSEKRAGDPRGLPAVPGRSNQGYEHTPDTKVPSPLLDYRSRLEARYAERTGSHVAASGRMEFGDLRDFQRRYFETFHLRAEVGGAEDPYVTLLKQRWLDAKGELR